MEIREAQRRQAEFDEEFWPEQQAKMQRICAEMTRLLTRLNDAQSRTAQEASDVLNEELIPDLFITTLQLANMQGVRVDMTFLKRMEDRKRLLKVQVP